MLRIHPSDAIVCFHGQSSAAFIPCCPRRSAWFSRFQTLEQISSRTTNARHTHTQQFSTTLFIHTHQMHFYWMYVCWVFLCMGRCEVQMNVFTALTFIDPETSQLFLVGKVYCLILSPFFRLLSMFLSVLHVALLLFVLHVFFFEWQQQKLGKAIRIYAIYPLLPGLWTICSILVSVGCVFVCFCLQANISSGIYRDKIKMQLCPKYLYSPTIFFSAGFGWKLHQTPLELKIDCFSCPWETHRTFTNVCL